jgi:hypothetical protein
MDNRGRYDDRSVVHLDGNNEEQVLAAVRRNGWALFHASAALKRDRNVVLAAVEQNGMALEYASVEMQRNPKVVLAAVMRNGWALQCASAELRENENMVLLARKQKIVRFYDSQLRFWTREVNNIQQTIHETHGLLTEDEQMLSEELRYVGVMWGQQARKLWDVQRELQELRRIIIQSINT